MYILKAKMGRWQWRIRLSKMINEAGLHVTKIPKFKSS